MTYLNSLNVSGSPPRVRSRLRQAGVEDRRTGITSACAEQTPVQRARSTAGWDHLRVCGADTIPMHDTYDNVGSPPRVRSRRISVGIQTGYDGITSACAEQTVHVQ